MTKLFYLLLAAAAGALTAAGYAPWSQWLAPLAGLAALYLLIRRQPWRIAGWRGLAFGCGFFGVGVSWVHVSIATFGGLPLIASLAIMALLVLYLALYPALAALLTALSPRCQPLAFAGLWLLTEWLRGWLLTGFPWLEIGASQMDAPWAGFLAWGGASSLSLFIALLAATVVEGTLRQRWYLLLPVVALLVVMPLSERNLIHDRAASVAVALVQGNVAQLLRWDPDARDLILDTYRQLLTETAGSQLVIWPEAAIPVAEGGALSYLAEIDVIARNQGSALVTGIVDYKPASKEFFNNLVVVGGGDTPPYFYGHNNRYSKHHLLPVGEFVPLGDLLRPLAPLFNLPMSDFSRGAYVQPNLQAAGLRLLPALCYEIAFTEQLRANLSEQTHMLLTVSNDAWFGTSHGPAQHNDLARLRAMELGRPVIRATNTGITSAYDGHGRELGRLPQFEKGVLKVEVPLTSGMTAFSYVGQWPALAIALLLSLTALGRRRTAS